MSMADVTNAEIMGGMFGPNQFSSFPGKIPLPGYVGTPTDAQGRPISVPQGMTLNSTPAAAAQPASKAPVNGGLSFAGLAPPSPGGPGTQAQYAYNLGLGGIGPSSSYNPASAQGINWLASQQQQPAATSSSSSPGTSDFNTALSMLANPGHVVTPGANVGPSSGGDGMSQFLANQGQGSGGFSNKGFFDTLNALRSGGGAPQTSTSLAPDPGSSIASAMAPVSTPGLNSPGTVGAPYLAGGPPPPQPSAGGLGGLGGLPGVNMGAMGKSSMPSGIDLSFMQQQPWRGMGSGNGGAAGNGSAGGQ